MRVATPTGTLLLLFVLLLPGAGRAFELEESINSAGVVNYPTAHNQLTTNTFHLAFEITDIAEPDLTLYNFRYGFQLGIFQLISDLHYTLEPVREFDHGELRAKFQVLSLEEFRFALAIGLLGRAVEKAEERGTRIDDKPASLFAVTTIQFFPIPDWGGFLFNFYLDNRYFTTGLKVQLYQSIQAVSEVAFLHSTDQNEDPNYTAGISLEGLENFYFQLLLTDQGEHVLVQIGTGF